jgi:hypothetical protein
VRAPDRIANRRGGESRCAHGTSDVHPEFQSKHQKGRRHLEEFGAEGRILVSCSCEHGNELSGYTKVGGFLG